MGRRGEIMICAKCGFIGPHCHKHGPCIELDAAADRLGLARSTFRGRVKRHRLPTNHPQYMTWERVTVKPEPNSGIAQRCRDEKVSEHAVRRRVRAGMSVDNAIAEVKATLGPDKATLAATARAHGIDETTFRRRFKRHLGRGLSRNAALEAAADSDVQRMRRRTRSQMTPAEVFTRCR